MPTPPHVQAQFPEIVAWQSRCRLCKLARDKPGLARTIHAEYKKFAGEDFQKGGADALAPRIAGTCESNGVPKFDPQNLRRHFGNHVDDSLIVEPHTEVLLGEAQAALHESLAERFDDAVSALKATDPSIGAHGKNDNDYFVMWDIASRLLRRIRALDEDPTAFFTSDSKHDMHKLNVWSGMISNMKGVVESLNKMRNSDKLTVSILEQHTVRFAQQTAALLSSDLQGVLTTLRSSSSPEAQQAADQLTSVLADKLPRVFQHVADSSLQEVKNRYGLN